MGLLETLLAWVGLSLVATPFIGRLVAQHAHEAPPRSPRGRVAFTGSTAFPRHDHIKTWSPAKWRPSSRTLVKRREGRSPRVIIDSLDFSNS